MTESRIYKMGHGAFWKWMMAYYGRRWMMWLAAVVLAGMAAAAIFDIRLAIVALMIVFIIVPMLAAMLYVSVGFKKENVANVIAHRVRVGDARLEVEVMRSAADSAESEPEEPEVAYVMGVDYAELKSMDILTSGVTVKGKDFFLWLPPEAFADEKEFADALRHIGAKMQRK